MLPKEFVDEDGEFDDELVLPREALSHNIDILVEARFIFEELLARDGVVESAEVIHLRLALVNYVGGGSIGGSFHAAHVLFGDGMNHVNALRPNNCPLLKFE